jgi:ATP-dependent RNA helicase HelY
VLAELGYLTSAGDPATVTESGRMLSGLYTESDLLAAQSLRDGTWNDLTPSELAAVCSAVVYESRSLEDEGPVALPTAPIRQAVGRLRILYSELHELEARHQLAITRLPDAGLCDATYRWAQGAGLLEVLLHSDITAGDFVRWMRQVIDLLGQLAQANDSPVRQQAARAADLVNRGVVAYSSAV